MNGSNNILIVAANEETSKNFAAAAYEYGFSGVSLSDGKELKKTIKPDSFELVIISTPLENEFGLDLASFISNNTASAVILTAEQKNCEEINKKLGDSLIYVLPRPLNKQILFQTIHFALTARKKLLENEEERKKLETKLYNIKQINRAKCVLMQYLRITESDAHRQIQKRAMDQRVPEIQIALDILKTYEI